jgi:hypothetical protein
MTLGCSNLYGMHESDVVSEPRWTPVLIWGGFPLVGAGAGWALKSVAGWVAGLEWAPFQGPFKLLASMKEPNATIVALLVGGIAGLVFATLAAAESLTVTVSGDSVEFARRWKEPREIHRTKIASAFMDGKSLVLLGTNRAELAREKSDLDGAALQAALEKHGYTWLPADPHAGDFRRWVEDDPAVPGTANALLKARAKAISKDSEDDIAELRTELANIGIVVRDEKKRQYWRQI